MYERFHCFWYIHRNTKARQCGESMCWLCKYPIFFKVAILFRIPFLPAMRASKPSRSELIFDVNVLHFSYSLR